MSNQRKQWSLADLRRITTGSQSYLAEVDGLRFLAISGVLLFHIVYAAAHRVGIAPAAAFDCFFWSFGRGHRGVELFFVISGFILGLPFAKHYLTGSPAVNVGRFYWRRITRLEPPYIIALLLFYGIVVVARMPEASEPGFWTGFFLRLGYLHGLVRNVVPTLNGVTWTLEIEVQFYLLAPLLTQVFRLPPVLRRSMLVTAICVLPLARALPWSGPTLLAFAQFFLMGLLMADLQVTGAARGRVPARTYDCLAITGLGTVALAPGGEVFSYLFPWLLALVFLGALRGEVLAAVLRLPLIAVSGGMCYSLYLLHYPIYSFVASQVVKEGMSMTDACLRLGAVALPLALAAGVGFYILVERPCMNPAWPRVAWRSVLRFLGSASGGCGRIGKSPG